MSRKLKEDYTELYASGEQEEEIGVVLSKKSLDAQVKAYFQRFEQDAAQLSESFHYQMSLYRGMKILFEQAAEDKEPQDPDASVDALDNIVSDVEGGSDDTSLAILPPKPSIDLEMFASDVSSLLSNIENKLDFKNPIINMAVSYIEETYGKEKSNQLIEVFREYGYKIKIKAPEPE